MEFLDMNLTTVFFSMLFTVTSTGGFYRKPYSTLVFKLHKKNPQNKKTRVFCRTEKTTVENRTKTGTSEDSSLCPETSTKTAVQEFHLRILTGLCLVLNLPYVEGILSGNRTNIADKG
jgi:hypothetical protein